MGLDAAVALLIALLNNSGAISAAIQKARSEGRDNLLPEEWAAILSRDDVAAAGQLAALAKAKAEGR